MKWNSKKLQHFACCCLRGLTEKQPQMHVPFFFLWSLIWYGTWIILNNTLSKNIYLGICSILTTVLNELINEA